MNLDYLQLKFFCRECGNILEFDNKDPKEMGFHIDNKTDGYYLPFHIMPCEECKADMEEGK